MQRSPGFQPSPCSASQVEVNECQDRLYRTTTSFSESFTTNACHCPCRTRLCGHEQQCAGGGPKRGQQPLSWVLGRVITHTTALSLSGFTVRAVGKGGFGPQLPPGRQCVHDWAGGRECCALCVPLRIAFCRSEHAAFLSGSDQASGSGRARHLRWQKL